MLGKFFLIPAASFKLIKNIRYENITPHILMCSNDFFLIFFTKNYIKKF